MSERAFLAGDFPQRLILRSRDFLRMGPALVYGLYRAGLRLKPLPTLIAVEMDESAPISFALAAILLSNTDPTPETRRYLRRVRLRPTSRRLLAGIRLARLRRLGHRGPLIEGLARLLDRRPTAAVCRIVACELGIAPPNLAPQKKQAKKLASKVQETLLSLGLAPSPDIRVTLEAMIDRRAPPAHSPGPDHADGDDAAALLAETLYAAAEARHSPYVVQNLKSRRAAAGRAEDLARRADLSALAAVSRSFRRRVSWNMSPQSLRAVLVRSLRAVVMSRARNGLWNAASDLLFSAHTRGDLRPPTASVATGLLVQGGQGFQLHPQRAQVLASPRSRVQSSRTLPTELLRHQQSRELMENNRFARFRGKVDALLPPTANSLFALSLGVLGRPDNEWASLALPYGSWDRIIAARVLHGKTRTAEPGVQDAWSRKATATHELCRRSWTGQALAAAELRFLQKELRTTTSWAARLVLGITLAESALRTHKTRRATASLAQSAGAYRALLRLSSLEGRADGSGLLGQYEELCRSTLASFEPPLPPGKNAVAAVVRASRRIRRRRHQVHPSRVMDALDVVITAGHAAPEFDIERRVIREIAKMLGGWVLLHYRRGAYLSRRPQEEHTLSTWTVHRLARESRLRTRRIRERPEFWRPDQHRPRGVLSVPIGEGVACIAASRPFTRRDVRTVRTVLRFLEARQAGESVHSFLPEKEPNAIVSPSLAGEGLIGKSAPWLRVLHDVSRVATATCSVILHGETGTGKERLARAIHSASDRAHGPFVAVNCGAIAPDVMASELFGHIRGAFTGAERSRQGLIQQAHQGTLFLDEVADMPPPMQVALLRVLEAGELVPVGASRPRRVDVRVVCASHRDLQDEVALGRFRDDLFHRLNVLTIYLPPLRDRGEDLLLLAHHLLQRMVPPRRLHRDAPSVLARHDWPGNVRELDNVLQAAALLSDEIELTPETLADILAGRRRRGTIPRPDQMGPRTERLLAVLGTRWLGVSILAQELRVSVRTVNRELRQLLDRGVVEAHGNGRQRTYRRTTHLT